MNAVYADTSAMVAAYLADEPEHASLRYVLLGGNRMVVTSELTRVEFVSAMTAAKRQGRIPDGREFLYRFDQDVRDGLFGLIPLAPHRILPAATRLVSDNVPVRTLDAIHIAVAMHDTLPLVGGQRVAMVTRDHRQAEAAKANGMEVL